LLMPHSHQYNSSYTQTQISNTLFRHTFPLFSLFILVYIVFIPIPGWSSLLGFRLESVIVKDFADLV
jgi:hypothetical protein